MSSYFSDCRCTKCRSPESLNAECHYRHAKRYSECHYTECRYAKCHGASQNMLSSKEAQIVDLGEYRLYQRPQN